MKKSLVILIALLVASFVSTTAFAVTAKDAPENITIDDCIKKKSAVEFPHKLHFDSIDCATCHHQQEDLKAGMDIEVKTCSSCHLTPEKPETPVCTQMSTKKNPYHILCISCHKDENKADTTKVLPAKCTDCHPKA